jgi:chromosome partitioning protein
MIVTVGNTKGGVGKTTLAVNIAIARALAGRDVWLIDGDRQGTAQTAIAIRAEAGHQPGIACATYPDGPTLRSQVQQQRAKFDDIIIDAGGRDSTALRAALILSDMLLVPFQPRSYDVWALDDIAKLIDEARAVRDGLRPIAVLNCADPGEASTDNADAAAAVAGFRSSSSCRRRSGGASRSRMPRGRGSPCLRRSRSTGRPATRSVRW